MFALEVHLGNKILYNNLYLAQFLFVFYFVYFESLTTPLMDAVRLKYGPICNDWLHFM